MPAVTPAAGTASWTIAGGVATTRNHGTEARLDLGDAAAGLAIADGEERLLGLDLRGPTVPPADHWVRGTDLTAIYEPQDPRRLRATAMWRMRPGDVAAWELVVSAQTALMHADAALAVVSECGADEARWAAWPADGWQVQRAAGPLPAEAAFVLARRGSRGVVIGVHPQDPRRIEVSLAGDRARVACGIFPTAIEKGVILRSRVLAAVGPAADAETWAAELCAAFASSPPFLDT